jgi:hypothetical protein
LVEIFPNIYRILYVTWPKYLNIHVKLYFGISFEISNHILTKFKFFIRVDNWSKIYIISIALCSWKENVYVSNVMKSGKDTIFVKFHDLSKIIWKNNLFIIWFWVHNWNQFDFDFYVMMCIIHIFLINNRTLKTFSSGTQML